MNITHRLQLPVFAAYITWVFIRFVYVFVVWGQNERFATFSPDTSGFLMAMFWGVFGADVVLGAILAWYTQANRSWARWVFVVFCFTWAVDCLMGTLAVGPLYEGMSRPYGLFRGPISFVIWGYMIWLAWSKRPNTAVKRDAPQAARPLP